MRSKETNREKRKRYRDALLLTLIGLWLCIMAWIGFCQKSDSEGNSVGLQEDVALLRSWWNVGENGHE